MSVFANVSLWTDKQLVELIHVKALDALSVHQQSSLRYQSVTLFLRGRSTSDMFTESTAHSIIGVLCALLQCHPANELIDCCSQTESVTGNNSLFLSERGGGKVAAGEE